MNLHVIEHRKLWFVSGPRDLVSFGHATEAEAQEQLETFIEAIRNRQDRKRQCMCCASQFHSEGPHHRMCGKCRRAA